jgi:DNA-binding XRE family transcriptional regulator
MKKKENIKLLVAYDDLLKKVGNKIKELRETRTKLSATAFAKKYGINHQTYYRIEHYENLTLVSLQKVLLAHNLTLGQFFKDLSI